MEDRVRGQGLPVWSAATLTAAIVAGAPCPPDPGLGAPHLQGDVGARISFIAAQMDAGARRSRIWAASWGTAYGAAAVTQLVVAQHVSPEVRPILYVGAASGFVGVLTRSILIPRVIRERRRLRRRLAETGPTCETLHSAESGLLRSAKSEAFGRSLLLHLGAVIYNVGIGLIVGLAFDRPFAGFRQAAIGTTVGQVMIVTQPTTMIAALRRYRAGGLDLAPTPYLRPLSLRGGGGLSLSGRF